MRPANVVSRISVSEPFATTVVPSAYSTATCERFTTSATSAALGGPVMIAEGLYRQMRRDSWDGIGFLRFLNVNLAILNLLPIPVLDGGLIMFALFALVFRRRVPDFIVKWLSLGCMVILMGLMALLIGRDSWKSWKIHTYQPSSGGSGDSCATNELQNATSPSR